MRLRGASLPTMLAAAAVCLLLIGYSSQPASAAVTVSSFDAKWQGAQVVVNWKTATELNNIGFYVLRGTTSTGTFTKITPAIILSQCLGCVLGTSYSYNDASVASGQAYYYKLQSVDNRSNIQSFGPALAAPPSIPPTATRTRTPVPPTSTPTATNPPPTSAPPAPTLAIDVTLPPSATPTAMRVARVVEPPTRPRVSANSGEPAVVPGPGSAEPTPSADVSAALKEPPASDADEVTGDEVVTPASQNSPSLILARAGVAGVSGLFFIGSFLMGLAAVFLFARSHVR